mmetsp:Transcript_21275/g.52545  ORF Transcript_21275/g.52545 Transcript_21275/m.52545 type:complete len:233 (+) Transcript_21275:1346-2044(+)
MNSMVAADSRTAAGMDVRVVPPASSSACRLSMALFTFSHGGSGLGGDGCGPGGNCGGGELPGSGSTSSLKNALLASKGTALVPVVHSPPRYTPRWASTRAASCTRPARHRLRRSRARKPETQLARGNAFAVAKSVNQSSSGTPSITCHSPVPSPTPSPSRWEAGGVQLQLPDPTPVTVATATSAAATEAAPPPPAPEAAADRALRPPRAPSDPLMLLSSATAPFLLSFHATR